MLANISPRHKSVDRVANPAIKHSGWDFIEGHVNKAEHKITLKFSLIRQKTNWMQCLLKSSLDDNNATTSPWGKQHQISAGDN